MKIAYFYLLEDDSSRTYTRKVCQLIDQACSNHLTVYLYCATPEQAQQFDDDLWTFKDTRFVPHGLITDPTSCEISLPFCIIGFPKAPDPSPTGKILFNLTNSLPEFFQQYQTVIELVPIHEEARIASRERYKEYQRAGYSIKTKQCDPI